VGMGRPVPMAMGEMGVTGDSRARLETAARAEQGVKHFQTGATAAMAATLVWREWEVLAARRAVVLPRQA